MHTKHWLLALLVTAVWGLNFPITKLGLAAIDPLLLTGVRFTLAAFPLIFLIRRPATPFRYMAGYGLIFGVAMWALINLGIQMGVPAGMASLLIQFSVFFSVGWGVLLFKERVSAKQCLSIALAIGGLISLIWQRGRTSDLTGIALLLASALAWSIGNVLIKTSQVKEIFSFVVWASVFPPLPLFLLTWLAHGTQPFVTLGHHLQAGTVYSILFQVYGATHFSYWGWNLLLREYAVSRVAPLSLLIPVFGMISSRLILGETIPQAQLASILLILAALAIGMVQSDRNSLARACQSQPSE